jgi:hypothetical protein
MSHGLPYDWRPRGVVSWFTRRPGAPETDEFAIGTLIPWAHRVYELIEIQEIPEDEWTEDERVFVARARLEIAEAKSQLQGKDRLARWWDQHLFGGRGPAMYWFAPHPRPVDPVKARDVAERQGLEFRGWLWHGNQGSFDFYPNEHYPVCRACGEPSPCREEVEVERANVQIEQMERYADPTRCPACLGVVTPRQARETFTWNLYVPDGPPVTFHAKASGRCVHQLVKYRKEIKAAGYYTLRALDPDGPR